MPSEFDFEPRSPGYGPFLVSGCWCTLRSFSGFLAPFWAVSRTYRGVRGQQRSLGHEKVKPHVQCSSRLPSFGCFEPLLGLFWGENGFFSVGCFSLLLRVVLSFLSPASFAYAFVVKALFFGFAFECVCVCVQVQQRSTSQRSETRHEG